MPSKTDPRRFFGLELAGAKNHKTALAVLEYYPKEGKQFLLDCYDRIPSQDEESSDRSLIETIKEHWTEGKTHALGTSSALDLPPCTACTRKQCPMPSHCTVPTVQAMRAFASRAEKISQNLTPYTQRPSDIWLRTRVLPNLPDALRLDLDETLGGSRAPLSARMLFLSHHLKKFFPLHEVWPKLSALRIGFELEVPERVLKRLRDWDEGAQARAFFLERWVQRSGLFIYDRDFKKCSESLAAFDALISAWTLLLHEKGLCEPRPEGYPKQSSWILIPT